MEEFTLLCQSRATHGVRMEGQGLAPKKGQIRSFLKGNRVLSQQAQDALAAHARQLRFYAIGVDPVGLLPRQAKDDGFVCPVTTPGGAERAEEFAPHALGISQQTTIAQCQHEHARCAHRPDRMRA